MSGRRRRGRGEGALYRRSSDSRWVATVDLGYINGKRIRRTVYGRTQAEAVEARNRLVQASDHGQDLSGPSPTLGQWLDRWLASKRAGGARPSTMRGYVSIVENHVRPALGTKRLDRLKPLDVRLLIDAKLESGLSPTSVAHVLRLLRNALGEAERMDLVVRNVAKAVAMPSALSPQPYTLTIQDVRALLAEASGHRLHAFFATQMLLGLRRGEGLGLRWADIDLDTGSVQIRGSLQRVDGHLQLVPPKTRASRAEIVAPAGLLEILRKHRAGQLAERMAAGEAWPGGDFVFTSTRGTPLEPRNVNRAWDLVRTAAGLPQVRLHDLRHGYATVLTAIGVQPRVVMQMLRHANIAITMDTYAHVGLETQREAARSLDRALFGRD